MLKTISGGYCRRDQSQDVLFSVQQRSRPDDYQVEFFVDAWEEIGSHIAKAIRDFFRTRKLLKEVNSTIIELVPKVINPSSFSDYRPISCYNIIYKCITKVMTRCLATVLPNLVGREQTTCITNRQKTDNIMLAQELVHGYNFCQGPLRCALKVDLMKVFDSMEWSFLQATLEAFGFSPWLISRILACVTSPWFSVSLNGKLVGFFPASRGLRQGDPYLRYFLS